MDTSHHAINSATGINIRQTLSTEITSKLAHFCHTLAIPPEALQLDNGALAMLVSMRLFEIVTLKLRELDARLAVLESYKETPQ